MAKDPAFDNTKPANPNAPAGGPLKPKWMTIAEKSLGLREGHGAANNPIVVAFYADAGFPGVRHDDTPWCAAFVGATLRRSGLRSSGSLMARSYEDYGIRLKLPEYGCIGVKKRRGGAQWQGHVGFVVAASATTIWMLGGNQGDQVCIAAFPRSDFVAFVWPEGVSRANNIPLPTSAKTGTTVSVREA
jgi:uncharacterized protein (TIGR02594 family)